MLRSTEDSILPREGTSNMYGLNTESEFSKRILFRAEVSVLFSLNLLSLGTDTL